MTVKPCWDITDECQVLRAAQFRVTVAIALIVGLTFLVSTGLTFLISPMAADLELSDSTVEAVLAIPSIASLLVVFISGQLGDRLGHRRTLLLASVGFAVGGVVLAVAQEPLFISLGLALCGSTATAIQIVGLGLLQQSVPEGKAHDAAFTTYGMVFPLAFLVFPVGTSGLLELANWRWIPLVWACAGLAIGVIALLLLERAESSTPIGEWLTPLLAGVALASVVRCLDALGHQRTGTPSVVIGALVGLVASLACAVRIGQSTSSSFSLRPIADGTIRVLLVGVALVSLVAGTLTYVTIAMEYLYDLTPLQAAIAVIPAQAGGILGAKMLAGRAMNRMGVARAGRQLMLTLSLTMLPLLFMHSTSPAWYVIGCATLFNTVGNAAVTVLNSDVMGRAPLGNTGPVSSFRGAASSIGSALGVVVLGTSVISAVSMDGGVGHVNPSQWVQLAAGLRLDGVLGCAIALGGWVALVAVERGTRLHSSGS